MIRVNLKRSWYSPQGIFYHAGDQDIPDSLKDSLPSSASVIGTVKEVVEVEDAEGNPVSTKKK